MDVREKLIEILRKPIFPHELADQTEAVADFCPVVNHPGVCRYEEMDENKNVVRNDTLSVKE